MALHEDQPSPDYNFEDETSESLAHRKNLRRLLEDKLERKRLKEEFKDDFGELDGEFDWDSFDRLGSQE
jgi:hypothetical protein